MERRPILVVLTSHWISMLGVALVTLAGFSWLSVLPLHIRGHVDNAYIGLLVFVAIPIVFFTGLVLIPIGVVLANRRIAAGLNGLPDRRAAVRRTAIFFATMTVANIIIGSQVTYRAVAHMDTVQFCGQSCHVMKPEFTAHLQPPHQAVACTSCHVGPGASGWFNAKLAGTRQLAGVVFNTFPRPIESAMESNRLVSSADTCEQCHARGKLIGPRLRIITKYGDDAASTRTETVLMMFVDRIHAAHMGSGVRIRYGASDKKRQTIPWVEYSNGETRTYVANDAKPEAVRSLPIFDMQCVDCHNRAAHRFDPPDRAVDRALASGRIAADLPFVKKTAVALLKTEYAGDDDAEQELPARVAAFFKEKYPDIAASRAGDIRGAGQALLDIYQSNVFPDLKVTWGTYPNNLGHIDDPGCFRCHDDGHATASKKTITQDCGSCHQALAVDEASPEILKTLGVLSNLPKQ